MKRNFILLATLLLSLFSHAQDNEKLIAWQMIEQNKEAIGFTDADLDNSILKSAYYNRHGGTWLAHLQQSHLGLPVYNQIHVLAFKNDKLVSIAGSRVGKIEKLAGNNATPSTEPTIAVKTALAHKGITAYDEQEGKLVNGKWEFGNWSVCSETITAELMWLPIENNSAVRLVWEIRVVPLKSSGYFMIRVDARKNKVINEDNLTVSCQWGPSGHTSHENHEHPPVFNTSSQETVKEESPQSVNIVNNASYLVVPYPAESPKHPGGAPDTVFSPWKNFRGNAVSLGWHNDGGRDYTTSRGNNVYSQVDNDDNNGTFGAAAISSTSPDPLTFISTPNFSQQATVTANQRFALTNLFYWNNLAHDISYIHGFDEPAGNFQTFNQGRGGSGNDYVIADCQDAGGTNNANFATPNDGANPRMQMYLWSNNLDGSLDNGVVTHEYMHGISNRLTGGPQASACLLNAEQMGEGWSDYFSIMLTQNWAASDTNTGRTKPRSIGTYVSGQPITGQGIRNVRYCTDWAVNNKSFTRTLSSDKYDIGELWCSALWDMTWNIIRQSGKIDSTLFNDTGTGGNTVAMKLVIEGMKYQPCSPGLIDGRNAILKADSIMFGGAYECAIREAFRRRGMGFFASQGSSDAVNDQTPDFSSEIKITISQNGVKEVPEGSLINYRVAAISPCANLVNHKIRHILPANVTYGSGGNYDANTRAVSFDTDLEAGITKEFSFTVRVNNGTYFPAYKLIDEKVPAAAISSGWSTTATPASNIWRTSASVTFSAPNSFFCQNLNVTGDQKLFSPTVTLPAGTYPRLSFWHRFSTENGWDGGVVEAFVNDSAWFTLDNAFTQNGYTGRIGPGTNPLQNKRAFTGTISAFQRSTVDLSAYAGKSVRFRFWFGSDNDNNSAIPSPSGWYVDDIALEIAAVVPMRTEIFNASNVRLAYADTIAFILQKPSCENAEVEQQPSNLRVCAGSGAVITARIKGSDNTYQWQVSNDNGLTYTNIPGADKDSLFLTGVSIATDSNLYRIIVSNSCPSADTSDASMLLVSESVTINNQPSILNVCEGSDGNMKVSASGGIAGFQWQFSSDGISYNDLTGATDSIVNFIAVTGAQDGNLYRVKITSCNNVVSLPASLFVINKANITQEPLNSWICSGTSLNLNAASAGDSLSYQWQIAAKGSSLFQDIPGAVSVSLPISANSSMDSNSYRLIVRNTCNSADTSEIAILSISDSVFITKQPSAITICNGLDTSITVSIGGGRIAGYQWQKSSNGVNFADITGQTSPSLVFNDIKANELGNSYRVVIKACNNLISQSALITVLSSPQLTSNPQNAQICENSNHLFSASASGDGITYRWQVSTDGGSTFRDTGLNTGNFAVSGADINDNNDLFRVIVSGTCADPDTSSAAQLKVNTLITPLFGQDTRAALKKVCAGETKSPLPAADDNNVAGTWSPAFNGNQKTTYTFKPNNTCSKTDTLTVDVEGCRFITPNPVVNGSFVVSVNRSTVNTGPFIIQMYDSKGARVLTQRMSSNIGTVFTSAFSAGIYVVTLWGNDGKLIQSERIFIRH